MVALGYVRMIEFHAEMKNTPARFEQAKIGTSHPHISRIVPGRWPRGQ